MGGNRMFFRYGVVLLMCLALITSYGCSQKTGRLPINGTVTADGKPIHGTIQFRPVVELPIATTSIEAGKFAFDSSNGPFAGDYDVMVETNVVVKKGSGAVPVIPEKWEFSYQVRSDERDEVEFNLTSSPEKTE